METAYRAGHLSAGYVVRRLACLRRRWREGRDVPAVAGLVAFADFRFGRLPGRAGLAGFRFAGCGGAASTVV